MSIYRAGKITLTNLRASMIASYRPFSLRQSPPSPFKVVAFESGTTIPKGRVEQGTIKFGEEVEIMGLIQADPLTSRVTGVGMFNKIANQGQGHVEEEVEIMGLTQLILWHLESLLLGCFRKFQTKDKTLHDFVIPLLDNVTVQSLKVQPVEILNIATTKDRIRLRVYIFMEIKVTDAMLAWNAVTMDPGTQNQKARLLMGFPKMTRQKTKDFFLKIGNDKKQTRQMGVA